MYYLEKRRKVVGVGQGDSGSEFSLEGGEGDWSQSESMSQAKGDSSSSVTKTAEISLPFFGIQADWEEALRSKMFNTYINTDGDGYACAKLEDIEYIANS
jgi:hypothetical protein